MRTYDLVSDFFLGQEYILLNVSRICAFLKLWRQSFVVNLVFTNWLTRYIESICLNVDVSVRRLRINLHWPNGPLTFPSDVI